MVTGFGRKDHKNRISKHMNRHKKTKNTIWNEFFNSDCQWINHIDTEKRGQIHTVCGLPSIFPFRFYKFFFFSVHVFWFSSSLFPGVFFSFVKSFCIQRTDRNDLCFAFSSPRFLLRWLAGLWFDILEGLWVLFKFLARSAVLALWMMAIVTIKTVALTELH